MSKRAALSRFRVCDFTTGVVGPAATRWLVLFGAEVIKIENRSAPDPARTLGPFAHGVRSDEHSAVFNNLNVGKRGLAIDLGGRRGRRLAAELAAHADVVCLDHPGPDSIGLDLSLIDQWRPSTAAPLIVTTGPALWDNPGPAGEPPRTPADATAWERYAFTILSALWRRDDTGEARPVATYDHVELETEAVTDARAAGRSACRWTVACSDGWVAVECRDRDERDALAAVTAPADGDLERWCRPRSRWAVEAELQRVGVPVAAVRRPGERIDGDIATGARRLWPMVDHPVMGGIRVEGAAAELSRTSWSVTRSAPLLGQDTRWALTTILRRNDDELDRLVALGVIDP